MPNDIERVKQISRYILGLEQDPLFVKAIVEPLELKKTKYMRQIISSESSLPDMYRAQGALEVLNTFEQIFTTAAARVREIK